MGCGGAPTVPVKCPAIEPTVQVPPREDKIVIDDYSYEGLAAVILKLRELVEKLYDKDEAWFESWDDCP